MAEFSAPFDGSPIATESQWSRIARQWGIDGVIALDQTATTLKVTGSGTTTVAVAVGNAFVNGFYYNSDAVKNLAVPTNSGGAARVDLVVLRADPANNKVSSEYKTGGATAPPLTQVEDGVWEIPLAQCTVAAGASVVTASNVVDLRYLTSRGAAPSIPGARRASIKNQLLVEDTSLYVGDGAAWKWLASTGMKDFTYTPVWTAGASTISWGSGSQNIGRVQVVNKRVDLTIQLVPTGNPAATTDPISVSLPPGLPSTADFRSLFMWHFASANGEGAAVGVATTYPTTDGTGKIARFRYPTSAGTSASADVDAQLLYTNQPFNIRTGDVLTIDGSYWLA